MTDQTPHKWELLISQAGSGLPGVAAAAEAVLETAVRDRTFPGAAYGVLSRGAVAAIGAVGRFTYDADSPRVTPRTVYDLASVSKVVSTTAIAMLLWQRGQLDLDLPLGEVLPGFLIAADDAAPLRALRRKVTLRLLLTHASGLPASVPFYENCSTREQVLRAALRLRLEAAPGERMAYSDPGFILLAAALEVIAGRPLAELAQEWVFAPLHMEATGYCPPPGARAAIPPTEIDAVFRHRTVQGEVHDENCFVLGGASGHAGVFAPVPDLLRFSEAMLAPLHSRAGHSVFTAETIRLFTQRSGIPPGSSRALGWDTPSEDSSSGTRFSAGSFGHLGFTGTSLWIDPEADIAVVLLSNRTYPTRENRAIQALRPHFHDAVRDALANSTSGVPTGPIDDANRVV